MTLTQLRYLVAIADADLNISLAAVRAHVSQSGLSKQLKQLEDELGVLMFVRRGRSLEAITPAGEAVIRRARSVLAETSNIRDYAANERRESHGQLVIATTHTQAQFVLPGAIARIKQSYPQVSVHLRQSMRAHALELLTDGDADIAILSTAVHPPAAGIAVPLYRWQRCIVAPQGHPLQELGHAPSLEDLARYPIVGYEASARPESSLQRAFAGAGLQPWIAMTTLNADLIKTYVRAGAGVGLLAEMAIGPDDTDLCYWPAPPQISRCLAWAVLPRERVLRDYALDLVQMLAPRLDRRDLRRVLEGNQLPEWSPAPQWQRDAALA
jgi:LysR family cys regulon transcriptional activator